MAILRTDSNLSLEIKIQNNNDGGYIFYHISFLWGNDKIIDDSILKRSNEYWDNREKGTFIANDVNDYELIKFLKKAIDNENPLSWQSLDPDLIIAVYPKLYFPFLNNQERLELDNDKYTIIVFVDTYNLKESKQYSGQGISVNLVTDKQHIENFIQDLEGEIVN